MNKRICTCGCDHFRFSAVDPDNIFTSNTCRNCSHTLAEHINTIRSKQAE